MVCCCAPTSDCRSLQRLTLAPPPVPQSLPRILSQVVILGSQILGRAFVEAYKQAAKSGSCCIRHFMHQNRG